MTTDLLELSARVLRGDASIEDHHPFRPSNQLAEVGDDTAFVESFANVSAFRTNDGLCLVDTGSALAAPAIHAAVRGWDPGRLHTAVYTHGHIDHVFGTAVFEDESSEKGWPTARVIGHEAVDPRFDRYILTAGYNTVINQRQFRARKLQWPVEYRLECHHARGETDDHTWVWVPDRKVLCTGDLIIWCTPNAGNPQKVQRYARDWAVALRQMAELGAELLLPGHGLPVAGAADVRSVLVDSADLLDSLHDQTVALMNEGARLSDIVHTVQAPAHLLDKPYLRPIYDDPEFIVRNIWRLYGGWYDGNPAHLKPAPDVDVAREVASLAGGPAALAERARALADGGDLRLAAHLAEMAAQAAPEDPAVHEVRADVYRRRVAAEPSLMAKGVFSGAAAESEGKSQAPG
jgi:alkyl sulfatase BDS1-like metallo-beta-lactamase superfamily hydrolase